VRTNGEAFSERTLTLVVNAHGALIQLREQVVCGHMLKIKNLATKEDMNCTVVGVSPAPPSALEVGVEFPKPCPRFWRVSFPPSDWSPRGPEAKRMPSFTAPAKPVVVKK